MTFEEWWSTQALSKADVPGALRAAFKEIANKAWFAAIGCPKCGRDMRLSVCRYGDCGTFDVEKYYKDEED